MTVLLLAGCPGASAPVNDLLSSQLKNLFPDFDLNPVVIRTINQTGANLELELLVDGLPQTIFCTAVLELCDTPLPACPTTVETVQQRLLDPQGRFLGGRNFDGAPNWIFNAGEGEFKCGDTIIYKFTDRDAEAFVL